MAAATNAVLALSVLAFARRIGSGTEAPAAAPDGDGDAAPRPRLRLAGAIVFVTGFLAIGYEIVWFRVIGILVKDSPYAFSSVLFVYLVGLGAGSLAVLALRRRWRALEGPAVLFAMQWLIGLYVLGSILVLYHGIQSGALAHLPRLSFFTDLHPPETLPRSGGGGLHGPRHLLVAGRLLPRPHPAHGGGVSARLRAGDDRARPGGALRRPHLLVQHRGQRRRRDRDRLRAAAAAQDGADAAGLRRWPGWPWPPASPPSGPAHSRAAARAVAVLVPLALALAFFPRTGELYRALHVSPLEGPHQSLVEEGRDGVVVTFAQGERVIHYINGASHGGRPGYAYHMETIEALSCAPRRADILVIGYGAGSIVEEVLAAPGVERVTVVEINAAAIANLRKLPALDRMLSDPRITIVIDDGRRYLLRSEARYDLVLMDPLRTRTAYSNNLYSLEMAELVKGRLRPGGVAMVWTDEFKVLPRTWATAFEHLRMYSYFLLASSAPLVRRDEDAQALLSRYSAEERRAAGPLRTRLPRRSRPGPARDGRLPINRDWKPVTEYYLGRP